MLRPKFNLTTLITLVLTFLFIASAVVGFVFYKQAQKLKENPQKVAQDEINDVISKVSRHMVLPENETPTAAIVSDPEILKKNQPFFNNAKAGDRVLIYANALKAILYNPELDKIVEVAPLTIGGTK